MHYGALEGEKLSDIVVLQVRLLRSCY